MKEQLADSLSEILERVARDTIRSRMRTWLSYEFERNMLPYMLDEVTKNVRVEMITNANIPEEIVLKVRFDKTEITGGHSSEPEQGQE